MGRNYNSGGTKEFKADPTKQYLIARGCSEDRAVELCVAGKITLKQIPDYTDRLTVLRFGQLSIDPAVDAEIIRIANRVLTREKAGQPEKEETSQEILCDTCAFGSEGGGECRDEDEGIMECQHYEKNVADDPEPQDEGGKEAIEYRCGQCDKTYKTMRGLEQHNKKIHEGK